MAHQVLNTVGSIWGDDDLGSEIGDWFTDGTPDDGQFTFADITPWNDASIYGDDSWLVTSWQELWEPGTEDSREIEAQAGDVVESGFAGMASDYETMLGGGNAGILGKQRDLGLRGVTLASQQKQQTLKQNVNQMSKKGGFATDTSLNFATTQQQRNIDADYNIGQQNVEMDFQKGKTDYLAGLRSEMNQLIMDYTSVTEEAYQGSSELDDLRELLGLDEYTGYDESV